MDNSNYENSDSDKDVDLSLNCSVDQSFRLYNTLVEKKDSNNEKDEKVLLIRIFYYGYSKFFYSEKIFLIFRFLT